MGTEVQSRSGFEDLMAAFDIPAVTQEPMQTLSDDFNTKNERNPPIMMFANHQDGIQEVADIQQSKMKSRRKQNVTTKLSGEPEILIASSVTPMGGWTSNSLAKSKPTISNSDRHSDLSNSSSKDNSLHSGNAEESVTINSLPLSEDAGFIGSTGREGELMNVDSSHHVTNLSGDLTHGSTDLMTNELSGQTGNAKSDHPMIDPSTAMVLPVIDRTSIVGGLKEQPASLKFQRLQGTIVSSSDKSNSVCTVVRILASGEKSKVQSPMLFKGVTCGVSDQVGVSDRNTSQEHLNILSTKSSEHLSLDSKNSLMQRGSTLIPHFPREHQEKWVEDFDAPSDGFPCLECGSVFLCLASLKKHLQRMSAVMIQSCGMCHGNPVQVFYNKCAYWSHLRMHEDKLGQALKLSTNLKIKPLSIKNITDPVLNEVSPKVEFLYPQHIAEKIIQVCGSGSRSKNKNEPLEKLEWFSDFKNKTKGNLQVPEHFSSSPGVLEPVSSLLKIVKDASVKTELRKCIGCNKEELPFCTDKVRDLEVCVLKRKKHLMRVEDWVLCGSCNMVLPNECQLFIHSLLHKNEAQQYPCPECGQTFPERHLYLKHLKEDFCYPFVRLPSIKCFHCRLEFHTFEALITHISQTAFLAYYKCPYCQLAFQYNDAFLNHIKTVHTSAPKMRNVNTHLIHQCPLCKNICGDVKQHKRHLMENHLNAILKNVNQQSLLNVFYCRECKLNTGKHMADYLKHTRMFHEILGNPVICDLCLLTFKSASALLRHRNSSHSTEVKKQIAPNVSTKLNDVNNCTYVFQCPSCVQGEKKMYYATRDIYNFHFKCVHKGPVLEPKEVQLLKAPAPALVSVANGSVNQGKPPVTLSTVTSQTEQSRGKRMNLEAADVPQEAKKPKVIRRIPMACAKCDFTSSVRDEFQTHILKHKSNPEHQQCQECGTCFRSEDAVRKHLIMKHRVTDFVLYKERFPQKSSAEHEVFRKLTEPDAAPASPDSKLEKLDVKVKEEIISDNLPPQTESPALSAVLSPSPSRSNTTPKPPKSKTPPKVEFPKDENIMECKVCYKVFDTENLLRNHMRNHGMAFIRSRRRSLNTQS